MRRYAGWSSEPLPSTEHVSFSHAVFHRAVLSLPRGTGEHGVGIGKKEYLLEELGEGTVKLMKTIKRTLDPLNLFNPGKVRTHRIPPQRRES